MWIIWKRSWLYEERMFSEKFESEVDCEKEDFFVKKHTLIFRFFFV